MLDEIAEYLTNEKTTAECEVWVKCEAPCFVIDQLEFEEEEATYWEEAIEITYRVGDAYYQFCIGGYYTLSGDCMNGYKVVAEDEQDGNQWLSDQDILAPVERSKEDCLDVIINKPEEVFTLSSRLPVNWQKEVMGKLSLIMPHADVEVKLTILVSYDDKDSSWNHVNVASKENQ